MPFETVREYYASADGWLRDHPAGWFVVAVVVIGPVFAVAMSLLSEETLATALPMGLLFALTYATLTTLLR